LARDGLRRVVKLMPEHELIWIARNGAEAVQKARENRPDLVLMDLIMPEMGGVEATRLIMTHAPCAILLVTASANDRLSTVYDAMSHGALDVVTTPTLGWEGQLEGAKPLLAKIRMIARLLGLANQKTVLPALPEKRPAADAALPDGVPRVIAIGASTGGPQALAELLAQAPPDLAAAVLIAQHVDMEFAGGLAAWLNDRIPLPVELAREDCAPQAGAVYLAGTRDHLVVKANRRLGYVAEPLDYYYRPSADELFKSVARHWPAKGAGVLLTGMGRDGAAGLLALRGSGWHTIAQNEASCVVYGMPKAAAQCGAACEVLPLDEIGRSLYSRFVRF